MVDDAPDPILRGITGLVVLSPDARRAEQVRERCRAQMRRAPKPANGLGTVLLTGLCMIYLCALMLDLLRLR